MSEVLAVTAADIGRPFHGNVLEMIFDAGPMVQFVILILFLFSVISWAIILMKYRAIRRTRKENELFLDLYMRSNKLSVIFPESKKFRHSTIAEVFRAGYTELGKLAGVKREGNPVSSDDEESVSLELRGIDNIERTLNRACDSEVDKLERFLIFLATTGSACPFIGLFGTVWGIMHAFQGIGVRGAATLSVVAPGISEALVATAAGLAAAIPAVVFYNYYLGKIRAITVETENFSAEFLNIIERYYVRRLQ
ncbi:MAG: protein TolQ [Syntrophales bacterium]|nr:protein TolQ [Syntrophales bacterium]